MAPTVAEVSTPTGAQSFGTLPPFKTHTVDITGDASPGYTTGGYLFSPASLGFSGLVGSITLTHAKTAAGAAEYAVTTSIDTNGNLAVQFYTTTAATAPLAELANTSDASLYTVRLIVLGY